MTSSTRGRAAATAGALVAVLSLAACGSEVAGSGGSGSLPLLRIGTGSYGVADAVGAPTSGTGTAGGGEDPYPLTGTLPTGPSSATVYRFSADATGSDDVAALAKALGVTGTPTRHDHGWEVTARAGVVRVHDGGTAWSYSRAAAECPSYAVDIDNADGATSSSGCAVAIPPATTTRPTVATAPDDAAARAAAAPVLSAAGLDAAQARVLAGSEGYPVRTVVLDRTVDGLRTSGLRTVVDVDADGVVGAMGVLATPKAGDAYPIITAAAALDELRAMPRPEIAIACMQGKACPGVGPQPVTGAVLGLEMAYDAGAPVLVPAWLFSVTGSDEAVPVIAVERRYLADPTPGPNPVGSGPDATSAPNPGPSDGAPGSSPGSSGGVDPATPVPMTDPPVSGLAVQSVTLGKDGSTLVLTSVGGVCDDFSGKADETATTITVSIIATPKTPGGVCPAMAKEFTVTVALDAPWDKRAVVDAVSGKQLTVG